MSDSLRPHRRQPARLLCPWDFPGKNTGVGCHFLLQCMKVKSESEVAQSCLTLSDPMDCNLPGSSVHGIFQARVLEWGAIAFSDIQRYKWIKSERYRKIYHANRNQKKMGMAILIKVSIYQEDITIINIYALNNRPSKYVKQKLTKWKGEINTPMMIIGAINTSSQEWVKLPDRRKVREWNLNNIINPPDLNVL